VNLHVERLGRGPPVVLVHGSVAGGESTWLEQHPLAERWTLLVVDRPGFGQAPDVGYVDFEVDASLVAEVLGESAHLVAHSYGGVVSLLAAARRPEAVRSLTVIEPPAFGVAPGNPAVDGFVRSLMEHWRLNLASRRHSCAASSSSWAPTSAPRARSRRRWSVE
jgi:pimeloyl-ACP methyl ester carboxylesterase